jgi:hypothetical protein
MGEQMTKDISQRIGGCLIALLGLVVIGFAARSIVFSIDDILHGVKLAKDTSSLWSIIGSFTPLGVAFVGGMLFVVGCVVMTPAKHT